MRRAIAARRPGRRRPPRRRPSPSRRHARPSRDRRTMRESRPVRQPDYNRRVAVTGLGVISPVGNDKRHRLGQPRQRPHRPRRDHPLRHHAATSTRPAARSATSTRSRGWTPRPSAAASTSMHFGVAAAKQAVADSGLRDHDANRTEVGVVFGSGAGGQQPDDRQHATLLHEKRPTRASRRRSSPTASSTRRPGMIAIETGAIGHNICIVSACSTGTHNVGRGRRGDPPRRLHRGHQRLHGGAAARGGPRRLRQHARPGHARGRASRSQTVSRPFDKTRNGFVLGEGAGSLFLEDLELAKARGAKIYAEVVGYGSAADGWDMIQPIEGGDGSARAMKMALERRGVPADEVDLINPHGTSTPLGDIREARGDLDGLRRPRGARLATRSRSAATKSMTGHMMGAAGAFEAFATVMSVAEQMRAAARSTTASPTRSATSGSCAETDADADPLRPVEQHRPGRPQRRGHLQALRRRLRPTRRRPSPVPAPVVRPYPLRGMPCPG